MTYATVRVLRIGPYRADICRCCIFLAESIGEHGACRVDWTASSLLLVLCGRRCETPTLIPMWRRLLAGDGTRYLRREMGKISLFGGCLVCADAASLDRVMAWCCDSWRGCGLLS